MSIMSLLLVALLMTFASMAQDLRWTNKGPVRLRRQSETETDPDMADIALTLENLTYEGEIKPVKQEGEWLPTTQGVMQQYATPSRSTTVTLKAAVTLCRNLGGRLWDKDPQQALGFNDIEFDKLYWILAEDGSMAEYTRTDVPESIYDTLCTHVSIEEVAKKIEVRTVVDPVDESKQGCMEDNFQGLTLCLRPVKDFTYANDPNYRKDQGETKTLIRIQKEKATEQLKNIKDELTVNNFQSTTARPKIIAKLKTIKTNIDNIKQEDQKSFPNFRKIKTDWEDLMTQLQDLEGISTRIHHEEQIKQIKGQIVIDKGLQATEEQKWNTKWTNMIRQVEDNRNNIQLSIRTGREHTTREPPSETVEEEDQTANTVIDYFKNVMEEFKTKKRSYDEFCSEWQLDCGIIAWTSLIMIAIGLATMITAILLALKTYDLTKRVHRLYNYMDLQATRKEQEEDDSNWQTRISNPNDTFNDFTPNPTRNRAQMKENYTTLNNKINQTQQVLLSHGFSITDVKINQPGGQRDPHLLYREQGATSPLLGQ